MFFVFCQSIQDEVHRYAIKFHREKRSKNQVKSELEIKGIGPKTREQLIKRFKSVKRIKELSINELENEIGNSKAQIIFQYFHKYNK